MKLYMYLLLTLSVGLSASELVVTRTGKTGIMLDDGKIAAVVDALAKSNPPFPIDDLDLIFITHDDLDHAQTDRIAETLRQVPTSIAILPPSPAYALVTEEGIEPTRLRVHHHPYRQRVDKTWHEEAGIRYRIFTTKHQGGWPAIHISFLIDWQGLRIYCTGDSSDPLPDAVAEQGLDLLVMHGKEGPETSMRRIAEYRLQYPIDRIIVNHMPSRDRPVYIDALITAAHDGVFILDDGESLHLHPDNTEKP